MTIISIRPVQAQKQEAKVDIVRNSNKAVNRQMLFYALIMIVSVFGSNFVIFLKEKEQRMEMTKKVQKLLDATNQVSHMVEKTYNMVEQIFELEQQLYKQCTDKQGRLLFENSTNGSSNFAAIQEAVNNNSSLGLDSIKYPASNLRRKRGSNNEVLKRMLSGRRVL